MKRHLLFKSLLLLCALVVGTSSSWAVDTVVELNATNLELGTGYPASEQSKEISGITYKYHYLMKNSNNIQSQANNGYIYNSSAFPKDIKSVAITHSGTARATTILGSADGTNWSSITSGSGSITGDFSGKGYKYFKITRGSNAAYWPKIEITYGDADASQVVTPSFSPVAGTYPTAQDVEITTTTVGATIRYTTNGDDPTDGDAVYSTPISVKTGVTIKAKAFKEGMTASNIATAIYVIKPNKPTVTAAGATVTITGDAGCSFYYTTNGDAPTKTSTKYTAPFEPGTDCTIKAIAYDSNDNASDVFTLPFVNMPLAPKNVNSGYYVKVTDASDLENGDAILIVNESNDVAMSTTQNDANRGKTSVTISTNTIYAPSENVQKLVLINRTEKISNVDTEVFYFYTGSGYLYAASSSSNQLKTETSPDNNGNARATINISSGNATITFKGTNSRNLLKYNSSSSIFSCYTGGQQAVQIYKEVAHNEATTITTAEYATSVSSYARDFSATGITAYTATDNGTSVALNEITTGKVPANTPVVLYKKNANGTAINVPVIASAPAIEGTNDLRVSTGTDVANMYVLANGTNGVGFYPWGGTNLSAGKVYLQGTSAAREFLGFENGTTAIETVKTQKVDGQYYNLAGQRVANPTKGLYIVNGKKVIIK